MNQTIRQHQLLAIMLDKCNERIAELEGQVQNTLTVLVEMNLPQAEITRVIDGLRDVSGLNSKYEEKARLIVDLANLQ